MLAFGGDHLLCRRLAHGFRQARTDHRVLGGEGPVGDALPAAGHRVHAISTPVQRTTDDGQEYRKLNRFFDQLIRFNLI